MGKDFNIAENGYSKAKARNSIQEIMKMTELCSIATVNDQETLPHIATAFFAFDENFNLYIATDPKSEHGQHLKQNNSIAVSVYSTNQAPMDEKRGLQVFGTAERLKSETEDEKRAHRIYVDRFESWKDFAPKAEDLKDLDSELYLIEPRRIKIFDEEKFSKETWINAIFEE